MTTWPLLAIGAGGLLLILGLAASTAPARGRRPWRSDGASDVTTHVALLEARVHHQQTHDAATGLPNRQVLVGRLSALVGTTTAAGADGGPRPVAVLCLSIDRIATVRELLGPDAVDMAVVALAERAAPLLRATDLLARSGEDQLSIVSEQCGAPDRALLLAGALAQVGQGACIVAGEEVHLAVSVGVAVGAPDRTGAGELLRRSYVAMREASRRSAPNPVLFDPAMSASGLRRIRTERALHEALHLDELRLHYQPVIALDDGRVCGFEALVRWERPGVGFVGPGQFVPVAEETGLIVPLGRWVLGEACRQLRAWADRYPDRALRMAVNVSPRQLSDPGLPAAVGDALTANGLDPQDLLLEFTESALVDGSGGTGLEVVRQLRALGVRFAIDDFGTGYSSLAHLKHLPLDVLKLDRCFVAGIGRSATDTAIVDAVVDLARGLGLTSIAEGVETREQADHLGRSGFDQAQGFLWSRALPAQCAERLLGAGEHASELLLPSPS
jgi:diguanylate cyclase (GGDEF)-like protein